MDEDERQHVTVQQFLKVIWHFKQAFGLARSVWRNIRTPSTSS